MQNGHFSVSDPFLTAVSHFAHPSVEVVCPCERSVEFQVQFPWVGSLLHLLNSDAPLSHCPMLVSGTQFCNNPLQYSP